MIRGNYDGDIDNIHLIIYTIRLNGEKFFFLLNYHFDSKVQLNNSISERKPIVEKRNYVKMKCNLTFGVYQRDRES